jgi:hypothetical protein
MKNKIIGIFVFMTLIITTIPVIGTVNINNNQQNNENNFENNEPPCGTAYIILVGDNETAKKGAVLRFYSPRICWVLRNNRVFADIDVINQTDPELPHYGEYVAIFDGCGCYQAVMLINKGWCGIEQPWIIIENNQDVTKYIHLKNHSCDKSTKSQSRYLHYLLDQFLQEALEKIIDRFSLLAVRV